MDNREILFRAIAIHGNEWVFGNYIHSKRMSGRSCEYRIVDKDTGLESDIIPETLGQFTGLLGENGKKIFEGDKVIPYFKNDNGHIPEYFWVVKYHECYFYMESINRTPNVIETMFDFNNIIIIGTIHDHLLKGG